MARASIIRSARRALARFIAPEMTRGFDAAGWKRFPREARMGRTSTETLAAASQVRAKARYYVANDGNAAAAVNALVTYGVGAGPMPAHANAEAFTGEFWDSCDADGRTDFGGLVALAVRAMIVDGEALVIFRQRVDGLKLQLIPAEQLDESKSADLGGAFIASGIEFNAAGERVAYWIKPYLPTQQFETYAQPVRVDAADVLHLFKPDGIGQIRGVSWFAPILLKLADLGLLSDALLKNFQVSALNSVYLIDRDGVAGLPASGDAAENNGLDVSLEPGATRVLRGNWEFKANTPTQAQQSIEFLTATIETIAAGLGVPAHMVSHNVSRANYSSLRAALITFKAHLEALQYNVIVPQLLTPIWKRWALTEALRDGAETDSALADWRFPAAPEADPLKQLQATKLALDSRLMSRAEAIAQRGESIERVDADIAADPFAQDAANENDPEQQSEDSNDA